VATNFDRKILDVLACPLCKSKLHFDKTTQELICKVDKLAYPIKNNIPVMLPNLARKLVNN
jgi:uncharacterized protein